MRLVDVVASNRQYMSDKNSGLESPTKCSRQTLRLPPEAFAVMTPPTGGDLLSPLSAPSATPAATSTPGSALSSLQRSYDMRCGERIAVGGFGTVYTALCRSSGETVVVKNVNKPPYEGRFSETPKCDEEAQLLRICKDLGLDNIKSCGGDGGVTTVLDAYSDVDSFYMVCQHEGEDLQQIVASGDDADECRQSLNWSRIAQSLSSTLTALHHCGILHNDIRPENIAYSHDGDSSWHSTVKLIDLGLASTCHCPAHSELLHHSSRYADAGEGARREAIRRAWDSCTDADFKARCETELSDAADMVENLAQINSGEDPVECSTTSVYTPTVNTPGCASSRQQSFSTDCTTTNRGVNESTDSVQLKRLV